MLTPYVFHMERKTYWKIYVLMLKRDNALQYWEIMVLEKVLWLSA